MLKKTFIALVATVVMAIVATSVSFVYDFAKPEPFSGPDIFNPYGKLDTAHCWKRANFHTHTKVRGIFNECDYWPGQVDSFYRALGYDIVTFSNHNELTEHPYSPELQVDLYEHGINLFKFHKLVFGADKVRRFDHLLPLFSFQRQFQLDLLGKDADFIQMNHPLRTTATSKDMLEKLDGYRIMELDSGRSTENEYWDWALSAGHYSFGLANDDLHYPDRSGRIAARCSFLCTPTAEYGDIRKTLLGGCYYSMRVPDYGKGDWSVKHERNRNLPYITDIGLDGSTIRMTLSVQADSIKVTGQEHKTLSIIKNSSSIRYTMDKDAPYARMTAYFPEGEVIYTNPFARYDSKISETPYRKANSVNITLTILYNLIILILCAGVITIVSRTVFRK